MGARKIFANMAHLLGGKAVAGMVSLVYIALATRMLGVEDYGVLNLVHGFATFLGGLVAFSGFHGMVRFGADALERREHGRFRQLVRFLSLIELAMAAAAILVSLLLVRWAGRQMGWPEAALDFGPLYSLAILATVRATPQGMLQLANRFDLIGLHQAIMPLVRLAGTLVIWIMGLGLVAFLWVWLVSALAEGVSMWLMAWWVWRRRDDVESAASSSSIGARAANPGLFSFIMITNFDLTLRDFAPRATPLVIGWIAGPAVTGLFTLATRATQILYQPAQMLGQAAYPEITRLLTTGMRADAFHAIRRSIAISLAGAVMIVAIMAAFGVQIMTLMGGPAFAAGASLLVLVAVGRAIMVATPVLSAAVTALGRPGDSANANLVTNLLMLPLLLPMLRLLGPDGVGWHVIAQSIVLVLMLGWSLRRATAARALAREV